MAEPANKKIEDFIKDYGELVKKHGVDFATFPQFVPDGQGGFRVVCQSVAVDLDEVKKAQLKEAFMSK